MAFVIALILAFVVIAVIGYVILCAATIFLVAVVAICSLIAYFALFAILGDDNAGMAMLLSLPVGIAMVGLIFKDSGQA